MQRYEHPLFLEDIQRLLQLPIDWEQLRDKTFLISGASGNIASVLIDVLLNKNLNIKVFALGRSEERARKRFAKFWDDPCFNFAACDVNKGICTDIKSDYIFHAASNTHPAAYSSDPIGTITTNIIGTYNLLEYGASCGCKRFVYASSVEIYGENRGDTEYFDESYLGYIDCNTMRAGYPESKRAGEALCQAYIAQKGMDIVIPRLARTYGPSLLDSDTKAISQFIQKGVSGEDIVLKSEGKQLYSYSYVADAVSAILYILLYGENGVAYNVADSSGDKRLKELAKIIADEVGTKVIFELPDDAEAAGYSTATKALLDAARLRSLGWRASYTMEEGLKRTITILKDCKGI